MANEGLSDEFSNLLEISRKRGNISKLQHGQERRAFPRLKITSSDIWIDSVAQFSLVDMSPSGVALNCNHPVKVGKVLRFSLGPLSGAGARVLACELEESPTEHLDAQYRVTCRFLRADEAMNLIVMAQQLDDEKSHSSPASKGA